ncbi:MAG: tail fiber protein [Bacteroidota bacterium]
MKPEETLGAEPFIGEIAMFAGTFAPRGWALCDGSLLPISQNTALFSLLGTTYGGDGRTTFALPDLRGRVAVHAGRGPGLSERRLGSKFGSETISFQSSGRPVGIGDRGVAEQKVPSVMQPSLAINYIIALQGTFPSRN